MRKRKAKRTRVAMPKKKSRFLWMRCGDKDDYNNFNTVTEATEYLQLCGISPPIKRYGQYGISDSGAFQENNYISIFWGDYDAQPLREMTRTEIMQLSLQLIAAHTMETEKKP